MSPRARPTGLALVLAAALVAAGCGDTSAQVRAGASPSAVEVLVSDRATLDSLVQWFGDAVRVTGWLHPVS